MEEVEQGEEWETRVQLGHSTTGKMFWNVDEMKPKERLAYFEKMVAWDSALVISCTIPV